MVTKIAWRNLWRNKTRTGIVILAIALSYGLMLWLFGVADYSYQEMGDATIEAVGGHLLVHGEGYWDLPTGGQVVADASARSAEIEQMPEVAAVTERVLGFGLLATADANEAGQLVGVNPDRESEFLDVGTQITEGEFLGDQRDMPIVIDAETAHTLAVDIGDRVVVTGSRVDDGEVTRGLFFVDGIYEGGLGGSGESRAFAKLADLQELLGYGDGVTQIGVKLYDDNLRDQIAYSMRQNFSEEHLEVLTWDEAVPELVALIEFDQAFTYLYVLIIMSIVVLGITNTLLMAVLERIREIGLFSALGLSPRRVGMMIVVETILVTLVGMSIGFLIGLSGHFWMVEYGIDMSQFVDLEMEFSGVSMDMMVIRSHLDPGRWITGSLIIFGFICLSSLYPAWRASRMAPAEAMRFYE